MVIRKKKWFCHRHSLYRRHVFPSIIVIQTHGADLMQGFPFIMVYTTICHRESCEGGELRRSWSSEH